MRLNVFARDSARTHEGAPAVPRLPSEKRLRRSVLSCLLWEDEFYEDGQSIAARIVGAAEQVAPTVLAGIAIEAREVIHLRHVPLLLLEVLSRTGQGDKLVADTVARVVQRADELAELVALHHKLGARKMIPAQMRKGLARAFAKFDAYALAKYDRDSAVKLRDVLRLVRPTPMDAEQSALWKGVKERTLQAPDTWEVALSSGADKKQTFERLLRDGKLGYLALLRNLRNMADAGVDELLVRQAILARKGAHRVLPFRYVAAARAAPQLEAPLDQALRAAIADLRPLPGKTIVLIDVSGSMDYRLSGKSDMKRIDAAAALGAIVPGDIRLFTFSDGLVEVPPRRGMAGVDAIVRSQPHGGTYLGGALDKIYTLAHDRLIVVTDEQSHDRVPQPVAKRSYMINVGSYRNGVGYGRWTHIDGFSEAVLRFIAETENVH
jgi:60 kDa SS-A/Ro ribonucleoprotein